MDRRTFLRSSLSCAAALAALAVGERFALAAIQGASRPVKAWIVTLENADGSQVRRRLLAPDQWETLNYCFEHGRVVNVREIDAHQIEL